MRYLSQRYSMKNDRVAGILTDIGTEELGHGEIICAIIYQLTKNLSMEEIEKSGFDKYYTDHTLGIWPQSAGGVPFNACEFAVKGDPITDLHEDMAADGAALQKQFLFICALINIRNSSVSRLEFLLFPDPFFQLIYNQSAFQLQDGPGVPDWYIAQ